MNEQIKNHIQTKAQKTEDSLHCLVQEMICSLNEVLSHERKHFNFYLQASLEVRGYERLYLKPLFEKEMAGELEHIRQFGDKIVALGGVPTLHAHPFCLGRRLDEPLSSRTILENAIKIEREVLEVYHDLYSKAEKFSEAFNDMSISLLLEENIEHTTADVEEMEKILNG